MSIHELVEFLAVKSNVTKSTYPKKLNILIERDQILLNDIKSFQNNPFAMLKPVFPALASGPLGPAALFTDHPTVQFLWPPDQFQALPDIN